MLLYIELVALTAPPGKSSELLAPGVGKWDQIYPAFVVPGVPVPGAVTLREKYYNFVIKLKHECFLHFQKKYSCYCF